jgi:hypothetical protein
MLATIRPLSPSSLWPTSAKCSGTDPVSCYHVSRRLGHRAARIEFLLPLVCFDFMRAARSLRAAWPAGSPSPCPYQANTYTAMPSKKYIVVMILVRIYCPLSSIAAVTPGPVVCRVRPEVAGSASGPLMYHLWWVYSLLMRVERTNTLSRPSRVRCSRPRISRAGFLLPSRDVTRVFWVGLLSPGRPFGLVAR